MSVLDQFIEDIREKINRDGILVGSPYGETRELTGVCLWLGWDDAREIALLDVREDHPELVPFSADAPRVARILRADATSRRAVSYIGRAGPNGEEEVCIPFGQFAVRSGMLQSFFYVRSVDLRRFPEDVVALLRAARVVADELALPLGEATFFVASAHVYLDSKGGKLT